MIKDKIEYERRNDADILNKIRNEIIAYDDLIGHNAQVQWCLKIIDKYRKDENQITI